MEGTPIIIKKKKAHGHAHHGGSWKVAYADFVTAMMAFFMVMWILGLSDEAKAQISGYFNDPMGYSKTQPMTRNIVKSAGVPVSGGHVKVETQVKKQQLSITYVYKKLREAIEKAMQKGVVGENGEIISVKGLADHIQTEMTKEGLRIEFREDKNPVFFESGSAQIRPGARVLITMLAKILADTGKTMKVEGHTDAVPYAQSGYDNWDLSGDRANSLRRALMSGGVKSAQLLTVSGYADTRLRDAEHPNSPVNRRVTILLPIADFGQDPASIAGDVELAPEIDIRSNKKDETKHEGMNAFGFRRG